MVSWEEESAVLVVAGDEDRSTQARRRRPLSRALVTARDDIVVDLTDLEFADASVMVDLAMIAQRLRQAGRALVLRGAKPHIRRLIELVGLDRLPGVVVAPA